MSNDMTDTASDLIDVTAEPSEPKMRVVIKHYPNPGTLDFNVNRAFTSGIERYSLKLGKDGEVVKDNTFSSNESEEIEPLVRDLGTKILAVPGVESKGFLSGGLSIEQYSIRLSKGLAFSDSEIERAVIDILAETFEVSKDEIEVKLIDERGLSDYSRSYGDDYDPYEDDLM